MVTFGILVDIESEMKCSFSHGVVALFESMIGGMTRNPARLLNAALIGLPPDQPAIQ